MTEKPDIVARLREMVPAARDHAEELYNRLLIEKAADEIEQLRDEVAYWKSQYWKYEYAVD